MTRVLVVLVALAFAFPAAAVGAAPQTNAPPGNSAIDEYLETVPGPSGNTQPRPPAGRDGGGGSGALTPAQRARLEQLGPDGKTLAAAVDATAPAPSAKTSTPVAAKPVAAKPAADTNASSDGRSPLGEVAGTFAGSDGGSGMGLALPAILLAALLAAIALVLLRRRTAA